MTSNQTQGSSDEVPASAIAEHSVQSDPLSPTPEELCKNYFAACHANDLELWLATLHPDTRATASSREPGPFQILEWEKGRARWQKYKATYTLSHAFTTKLDGYHPVKAMAFTPRFGDVPGYEEGEVLGADVELKLKRLGGEEGPWRILQASF